jgi:transcriptional regulator with XRE-family HTH domain
VAHQADDLGPARQLLADLLATLRRSAGLTQQQVAEQTGYRRATVASAESGHRVAAEEFWLRCDELLANHGELRRAYAQLAAARTERARRARLAAAAERDARVARLPSSRHAPNATGQADLPVLPTARLATPPVPAWPGHPARKAQRGDVADRLPSRFPALSVEDLRHLAAALDNGRYVDADLVDRLRQQVTASAANDGAAGPRRTLPQVLAVLAVVDRHARDAPVPVRRELLRFGARAAEFAGWLYRDVDAPGMADYWRDRAMEWAAEAGDTAMQGYVLVKKSQSAWDDRDAGRMLSLAQAAQTGPWQLPAKVRAEAAQQEARGHAMTGASLSLVQHKLDQAHQLLAHSADTSDADEPGAHYGPVLLKIQTALCYHEAGRPSTAADLLGAALAKPVFSRRDCGYFRSLYAESLAAAGQPDEAATVGLTAHELATATGSYRSLRELHRLADQLRPWQHRPAVRDLTAAVNSA